MVTVTRVLEPGSEKLQWIDRAKDILDVLTRAGTMYLGYQAFERVSPGAGFAGAIVSQIAMRLATAENLVGGAAGVATLAGMGIMNMQPEGVVPVTDTKTWIERLGLADPFRVIDPLTGEPMP